MQHVKVAGVVDTGIEVTRHHFGGNIIGTLHTEDGATKAHFREAIDALDISDLRYPAGEPDAVYSDGLLIDGGLPSHVTNFFDSIIDRPGQVVMTLPTFDAYGGPAELKQFVETVMASYGEKVRAFEVGNEYWQRQSETEYGKIADEAVKAIDAGMQAAGVEAQIWVQMANAGGAASEFREHPTLNWYDSTAEANKTIINQISTESLQLIDGVVEHVYLRDENQIIGDKIESTNMAWMDIRTWQQETGIDFRTIFSEWNIKTTNVEQLGVKAGSSLIQHFENLLELGADEMHVWSPQHNTKTDLAGSDTVIVDHLSGVVKNTVTGAAFDLMSSSLVGKSLVELQTDAALKNVTMHSFASDHEVTIYVASRSEQTENMSFSIGDLFPNAGLTSAVIVGYDKSEDSSDGMHFSQVDGKFIKSDWVEIDGQEYYLNEHDAMASISVIDVKNIVGSAGFQFSLAPYEFVELTYSLGPAKTSGTNTSDVLDATLDNDVIHALGGDDTVKTGHGDDSVYGGDGNDHLILGAGNDIGFGEQGNDFLSGWGGDDLLDGGSGNDTVFGFEGRDEIEGGTGDDFIRGGDDSDTIRAGSGEDLAHGDDGDDVIFGGAGSDTLSGDAGGDTLHGGADADRLAGMAGRDLILGGDGDDFIFGGLDADKLIGDGGADTILGGAGDDRIDGGDGNDRILGGAGNDSLFGGSGKDTIFGGEGSDSIDGGADDDIIFLGMNGTYDIHFAKGHGHDTIHGFAESEAMISLEGLVGLDSSAHLFESATQVGEDVVIVTGKNSSITVSNVALSQVDEDNFSF